MTRLSVKTVMVIAAGCGTVAAKSGNRKCGFGPWSEVILAVDASCVQLDNSPWMENPVRQKRNKEKDQNEDK
jgi:hypothetical protein